MRRAADTTDAILDCQKLGGPVTPLLEMSRLKSSLSDSTRSKSQFPRPQQPKYTMSWYNSDSPKLASFFVPFVYGQSELAGGCVLGVYH